MKIIELFLPEDSDEGGIDMISLVDRPAHNSNFLTFSTDLPNLPEENLTYIGDNFDADTQIELANIINTIGEPVGKLEKEGYEIFSIELADLNDFLKEKEKFIQATPNERSAEDTPREITRYKYMLGPGFSNPIIPTSREFCIEMINANKVFRVEDIIAMTEDCANEQFGCYNIMTWRGSFNCRHLWYKMRYRGGRGPRAGIEYPIGEATNPSWAQPSTQVNMAEAILGKDFLTRENFGVLGVIDGQPLFTNKEDALKLAEIIGCSGYHEYTIGDFKGFMACQTHEFASYDDYPQEASENACRVLKWIDEHGRDEVSGMEQTGLARANQLCKREPISQDTIARMASFERHRKNSEISPEFKGTPWKDKGYVAWLAWGGDAGVEYASRKLEQLKEEMLEQNPCWDGYEPIGLKDDGSPNCVPMKNSAEEFAEVGPRGGIRKSPKAPKSDTPNKDPKGEGTAKGSASSTRGAKVPESVEKILKEKSDEFNEKYKEKLGYGVDVGMLKSVYQRGVGAYNTSHSPAVKSSQQWALARVNAFLYLVREGRPENKKYDTDFDLLPTKHPKKVSMSRGSISGIGNDGGCCYDEDANLNILGYKTRFFHICPVAIEIFTDLLKTDNLGEDVAGMIRSAALQADRIFEIEEKAVRTKTAEFDEYTEALLLMDDFVDLMAEIAVITGKEYNMDFMLNHMEIIGSYLPQEMDIDVSGLSPYTDQGTTGKTKNNSFKMEFSYDEEKMEITGAAIIPNKMIIRKNPITEELYYVFFSEKTTKNLMELFAKNSRMDATNLNHSDIAAEGTYIVESWLVNDPQYDKIKTLGLDFPKGTWVITMKVDNKDLWSKIKQGEYNGFSVEGWFNERVVFN